MRSGSLKKRVPGSCNDNAEVQDPGYTQGTRAAHRQASTSQQSDAALTASEKRRFSHECLAYQAEEFFSKIHPACSRILHATMLRVYVERTVGEVRSARAEKKRLPGEIGGHGRGASV